MRDPERVVHAGVPIVGVAGRLLIEGPTKGATVRDAHESCGIGLCEKNSTLEYYDDRLFVAS